MSLVNSSIALGERQAQLARPATLIYAGLEVPCTPSNHDFFLMLNAHGGFTSTDSQQVRILRSDIPAQMLTAEANFHTGHAVQLRDDDTYPAQVFDLMIGDNNSWQSTILILNLRSRGG